MECRPLDIVIESAKDLKNVNVFAKMDGVVYAVNLIYGDYCLKSSSQKTPTDKDCGTIPFLVKFTIDDAAANQIRLTLFIKLMYDRGMGLVYVPIKELYDGFGDAKEAKHATYSVKPLSGKTKETLNISYKFGEKFTATEIMSKPAGSGAGYGGTVVYPPSRGYTPVELAMAYPATYGAGSGGAAAYPPPRGYTPSMYTHRQAAPGYGGYPPGGYPPNPQYPPPGWYPPQPAYWYSGYGTPVQNPNEPKKNGIKGKLLGLFLANEISDAVSFKDGLADWLADWLIG